MLSIAVVTAAIQVGLWLDKKKAARAQSDVTASVSRESNDPSLQSGDPDKKQAVAIDEEVKPATVD